jgi:hypothetical protein
MEKILEKLEKLKKLASPKVKGSASKTAEASAE